MEDISLVGVSVAVIAVAFSILVAFIIRSLNRLNESLESVQSVLTQAEEKVEDVLSESTLTLRETRVLINDVQEKSKKLDALVNSLSQAGKTVQEAATTVAEDTKEKSKLVNNQVEILVRALSDAGKKVNELSTTVTADVRDQSRRLGKVAAYMGVGVDLINRFRHPEQTKKIKRRDYDGR
ncbi:DUF948 domain-containing protein [Mechercharimyces sp. CAU 1602]|uniref:DUF948 domain-containing protein n=1 Tax=Mechercharimyces sp. CAU 1602 TaxID=2973933 RepID=UPI002161AC8C|nr:DUF948 domain-containing protein [Mechercharimyces sp. CAU 1602]MCS1350105.1 DUF948 domain-containing protein [Mechercharimyces sp. CAU 1602]